MYTVKVSFKDIFFDEDERNAIITFFLSHKTNDFSYYAIFDESEYIQSVHGDINVWVVNSDKEVESDENKYVIIFDGFENLIVRLEKLTKDLKEVYEDNKEIIENPPLKKRVKNPIKQDIKDSISDILEYFIEGRTDIDLLDRIESSENYPKLQDLFLILLGHNIKEEILQTLQRHLDEVDLDEFIDIVKHHAKISSKFSSMLTGGDGEVSTVSGEMGKVGGEKTKVNATSTNVSSINPFNGLFKL